MQTYLRTLLTYHRWADGQFLDACRVLSEDDFTTPFDGGWSSIHSILVHLAGAAEIWTRRLAGESPAHRPTEQDLPTLSAVSASLDATHARLFEEFVRRDETELLAPWTYRTLDGSPRTIPLWTVFHHVVNHGSYHRGQLANRLARRGAPVPVTDLVLWAAGDNP